MLEGPEGPAARKLGVFQRASELIASSRSFTETMEHTIGAFLPMLGDFGFFDLVVGDTVRRTARAHDDERVVSILRPTRWVRQERTDMNLCALSTGRPARHAHIDDAWYRAIAVDEGHLALLRELAFVSMVTVPMRYQGELLGALTLFFGRSARHHTEDDLAFAAELAAFAAPVVANARLLEQQGAAAEAVRVSEERLRIGLAAGQLGVWDWDVANQRVSWSDRLYDLHGVTREEFSGTFEEYLALIHPDDRARVAGAIEAALGGAPYSLELRVVFRDGSVRWLSTTAEVYRDAAGAPIRMIGATYDITERQELLAKERAARAEAEALAIDNARLLAEARAARHDAEAANRAKDEFLAMLGHELRNPLAPIVTALELMEARDGERSRREREVLQRQVSHMIRLVDDLLDIARIARGKITLYREPTSVATVIERAIEAIRPALDSKQLVIDADLGSRACTVDADPVRLAQIVGNLLSNAAKFSPAGERVTIRVTESLEEVEIAVEDRGAGLAPELLPRVFELFVQGPQALAREQGGLGLGLAIVSNLVAMHGGHVTAESAGLGRGSTFRVCLPRRAGS